MKNFVQPGLSIECVAPSGGVTAGSPVLIGGLLVVPATTADQGDKFTGHANGVFTVAKAAGAAWAIGDVVYWDVSEAEFTKTASTNFRVGVAAAAALSADTSGVVRLDGVSTIVEA